MQLTVQGKQIDIGDALRTHVSEKIEEINEKYFNHATDAHVTFSREGHGHGLIRTLISIHVSRGIKVSAEAMEGDPYLSFDVALAKAAKQMRRYKSRLRDRSETASREELVESLARDYVLDSADGAEEVPESDPIVVAEMTTNIQTMSVSEAVMRLDLGGQNALMFRNAKNGELNMVYRRNDGNVGWVDPANNERDRGLKDAAE